MLLLRLPFFFLLISNDFFWKTQDFKQNRKVSLHVLQSFATFFPENKKSPFPTNRDEVNRGSTLIGCLRQPAQELLTQFTRRLLLLFASAPTEIED